MLLFYLFFLEKPLQRLIKLFRDAILRSISEFRVRIKPITPEQDQDEQDSKQFP